MEGFARSVRAAALLGELIKSHESHESRKSSNYIVLGPCDSPCDFRDRMVGTLETVCDFLIAW